MQSVSSAFTAEEKDSVRRIAHNLQVSWKKFSTLTNRTFTVGVSTIGGNDVIGLNPGAIGSPSNYKYYDESSYVMALAWERGLNMPVGGISKALAEAELDNTSGRFTPRSMGGTGELFTSVHLPNRPFIINAGFEVGGIESMLPQFAGVTNKPARVNARNRVVRLQAADYLEFFDNKYLDQSAMFTGLRTDEWLSYLFGTELGMSTAQYDLDYGINVIPFGYFPSGTRFSEVVGKLVEAEAGHLYQDEEGIFRFENRQHWDSAPHTEIQKIVLTGQVLDVEAPDDSHLINVVEVKAGIRTKQPSDIIFRLDVSNPIEVSADSTKEVFINTDDPILAFTMPTSGGTASFYVANSSSDESGTDLTSSISFQEVATFAQSIKFNVINNSDSTAYVTQLVISGRTAKVTEELYVRAKDDSSVTAYEEHKYEVENPFIVSESWANSLAQMVLNDYAEPENIQKLTVRAMPELQLGDLVSWQGRYWRIFDIKTVLDEVSGFLQELLLLQRDVVSYFRIGISTIGGTDKIAP